MIETRSQAKYYIDSFNGILSYISKEILYSPTSTVKRKLEYHSSLITQHYDPSARLSAGPKYPIRFIITQCKRGCPRLIIIELLIRKINLICKLHEFSDVYFCLYSKFLFGLYQTSE